LSDGSVLLLGQPLLQKYGEVQAELPLVQQLSFSPPQWMQNPERLQ
jgi:hypothetical protein